MKFIDSISVVDGWLPATFWVLGVLGVLFLLMPRKQPRWLLKIVITAVAAGILTYAVYWVLLWVANVLSDPLPGSVLTWAGLGVFAVLLGLLGLRGIRLWRRLLTPLAVLAVVLLAGIQINAYFGQYVTIGSFYSSDTANLPTLATSEFRNPGQVEHLSKVDIAAVDGWHAPASMPAHGKLAQVSIPGTVSGFAARRAIVYLPPAYLVVQRPQLPVMVLVAGQPGSPQRWLDAGHLTRIMDAFAAKNQGLAPVVVVVDPNGSIFDNTMCMNSKLGNVDTYLSKDVPDWILSKLDVQANTSRWTFGGFSFGGTCAIQMGTAHPDVYPNVIDMSGQIEPALSANRNTTVQQAFGGDTAAFDAQTPMARLAANRYPHSRVYFSVGANDHKYGPEMMKISAAAKNAGMNVRIEQIPDGGHSWSTVRAAMPQALDWLAVRMGVAR